MSDQLYIKNNLVVSNDDGLWCYDDHCYCEVCDIDYSFYERLLYVGEVPQDILSQYPFEDAYKFDTIADAVNIINTNDIRTLVGYSNKHGYKQGDTYADVGVFKDNLLTVEPDTAYFVQSNSTYYTIKNDVELDYNIDTYTDMIGNSYESADKIYIQDVEWVRTLNYSLGNVYATQSDLESDYGNQTINDYYGYFDGSTLYVVQYTELNGTTPTYIEIENAYDDTGVAIYYAIAHTKKFQIMVADGTYPEDLLGQEYNYYYVLIKPNNDFGVTITGNINNKYWGDLPISRFRIINCNITGDEITVIAGNLCNCYLDINLSLEGLDDGFDIYYKDFSYCYGNIRTQDKTNTTTQGYIRDMVVNGTDCHDLNIIAGNISNRIETYPSTIKGDLSGENLYIKSGDAGNIEDSSYNFTGRNGGNINMTLSGTGTVQSGNGGQGSWPNFTDGEPGAQNGGPPGFIEVYFEGSNNDFTTIIGKGGDGIDSMAGNGYLFNASSSSNNVSFELYFNGSGNYKLQKLGFGVGGAAYPTNGAVKTHDGTEKYATSAGNNEIGGGISLYINNSQAYIDCDFTCEMPDGKVGGYLLPDDTAQYGLKNGSGGDGGAYFNSCYIYADQSYQSNISFSFGSFSKGGDGIDGADGRLLTQEEIDGINDGTYTTYAYNGISGGDSGNGGYVSLIQYATDDSQYPYKVTLAQCGICGTPGKGGDGVNQTLEAGNTWTNAIGGNGGNAGLSQQAVNGGNGGSVGGADGDSGNWSFVNAGNGGDGSYGIYYQNIMNNSTGGDGGEPGTINITGHGGNGGNGGDGLVAGNGANGSDGYDSSGNSASGGNGGNGGNGIYQCGNGGNGGNGVDYGGDGGNGGRFKGDIIYPELTFHDFTCICGDGGNGGNATNGYAGNGGDGGSSGDSISNDFTSGTIHCGDGGDTYTCSNPGDSSCGEPGVGGVCQNIPTGVTCIPGNDGEYI